MRPYVWSVATLLVACLVAGLQAGAAASRPGVVPGANAKKRCGKEGRFCPPPSADLQLTFGTRAVADYAASREGAVPVAVVVRAANHGPARAAGALMTVSYPRRYVRPESDVFAEDSCSDSVPSAAWAQLICPLGSIGGGTGRTMRLAFNLGAAVPRNLKIGFTVLSLTRDARLGNNFGLATPQFVGCAASYPTICVPAPPPSLGCADIAARSFRVLYTVSARDPQGFDPDHNGIGCESRQALIAGRRCKTVVKRVHGKKRHVRVCKKAKPKKGNHGQPTSPPPPPAAAKTLGQVTLPSSVSSLAAGEGAVWATLADNSLIRIDPSTLAVTARIADPMAAEWPPGVAVGAGSVWLSNAVPSPGNTNDGGDLLRIDPAANRIVATVPVGRSPEGMAFTTGAIWVANHRSDTALGAPNSHPFSVSRVDTTSNRETGRVVVERRTTADSWANYCCGPQGIVAGAGSVWVGDAAPQTVYRIDPARNSVVAAIHAPDIGDACGRLAADSSAVWVASGCSPALWRIDPLTNAVAATITLPGAADTVALGFGSVWATTSSAQFNGGEADLIRVDPATNLVVGKTAGGGALAIGEGAIWLGSGNVLFKLAPA